MKNLTLILSILALCCLTIAPTSVFAEDMEAAAACKTVNIYGKGYSLSGACSDAIDNCENLNKGRTAGDTVTVSRKKCEKEVIIDPDTYKDIEPCLCYVPCHVCNSFSDLKSEFGPIDH